MLLILIVFAFGNKRIVPSHNDKAVLLESWTALTNSSQHARDLLHRESIQ